MISKVLKKVNFIFLTVIFQPSISLVASSTELSLKSTASLPTTVSYQQGIILLIFIFIKCFGLITHFFQNLLWKIKTPPKLTILLMNHHRQLYKPKINTMVIYTIFSTRKNSSNHITIFFSLKIIRQITTFTTEIRSNPHKFTIFSWIY